jgi:hypothetical protein
MSCEPRFVSFIPRCLCNATSTRLKSGVNYLASSRHEACQLHGLLVVDSQCFAVMCSLVLLILALSIFVKRNVNDNTMLFCVVLTVLGYNVLLDCSNKHVNFMRILFGNCLHTFAGYKA